MSQPVPEPEHVSRPLVERCGGASTLGCVSIPRNDSGPVRGWIGPDWEATVDARRLDELRWKVEQELSTLSGFRRRLKTEGEYLVPGLAIGIPFLIPQAFGLVEALTAAPEPSIDAFGEWISRPAVAGWLIVSALLFCFSLVSVPMRALGEFRIYRRGGWLALQAPTGLVQWGGEAPTLIAYDHRLVGGSRDTVERDLRNPFMLVSGPRMPVWVFAGALRSVRASTVARSLSIHRLAVLRQEIGVLRAIPAPMVFPQTDGCLIGSQDEGLLTVALPRPVKTGQRIRLARVKLTRAERESVTIGHPS